MDIKMGIFRLFELFVNKLYIHIFAHHYKMHFLT